MDDIQKLMKEVYTPAREVQMEVWRQKYNAALAEGDKELAKVYGDKMMKQINGDFNKIYIEPRMKR